MALLHTSTSGSGISIEHKVYGNLTLITKPLTKKINFFSWSYHVWWNVSLKILYNFFFLRCWVAVPSLNHFYTENKQSYQPKMLAIIHVFILICVNCSTKHFAFVSDSKLHTSQNQKVLSGIITQSFELPLTFVWRWNVTFSVVFFTLSIYIFRIWKGKKETCSLS